MLRVHGEVYLSSSSQSHFACIQEPVPQLALVSGDLSCSASADPRLLQVRCPLRLPHYRPFSSASQYSLTRSLRMSTRGYMTSWCTSNYSPLCVLLTLPISDLFEALPYVPLISEMDDGNDSSPSANHKDIIMPFYAC